MVGALHQGLEGFRLRKVGVVVDLVPKLCDDIDGIAAAHAVTVIFIVVEAN